jgi:hypothetical protein
MEFFLNFIKYIPNSEIFCIYKALPFRDVMEYEIKRREEKRN